MARASTIFLLSPAYCGGRRAAILLNPQSPAVTSQALRAGSLSLGSAFAFMSGLYFRGKLAYANVSTGIGDPNCGLQPPSLRSVLRCCASSRSAMSASIVRSIAARSSETSRRWPGN